MINYLEKEIYQVQFIHEHTVWCYKFQDYIPLYNHGL